jgi:hypothetical protein
MIKKTVLVNTRLQPGGKGIQVGEPFQRLVSAGKKTVETVFAFLPSITGLKPGVNETALHIYVKR